VPEGRTFEPGMLILGAPAKAVRPLSDEEKAAIRVSAEHYAEKAAHFAAALKSV